MRSTFISVNVNDVERARERVRESEWDEQKIEWDRDIEKKGTC